MRYRATVPDIRQALAGAEVQVAKSVTAGMRQVTEGLKQDLRDDVVSAGLGQRLANTWRGQTFPKTGDSVGAATYISTNAPKLIDAFDRGVSIVAKGRKYLAIPTPDAGVRRTSTRKGSQALTPAVWERETGVKLKFVPTKKGAILVSEGFYRRQSRSYRNRKNFRPIKENPLPGEKKYFVIFILVREVKLRKRFDIDTTAKRWADRIPSAIAANWQA